MRTAALAVLAAATAVLAWRVIRLKRQAQLERAVAEGCATTDAEFFALVDQLWPDHP